MRPFLLPPKATTPADALRYYLRAQGKTITWLGRKWGAKSNGNARRSFYGKKALTPARLNIACDLLKLSDKERKRLHRMAARQQGWDV